MGAVFQITTSLEFERVHPCITCGVEMALLRSIEAQRRRDHASFYCPNGHAQSYTAKSKEEKLAEELAAATARAERSEKRRLQEAEQAKREVAAARVQVTKIKNRVGNGVCPCCNRSFTNLQRHMHTKHPGFANEAEETSVAGERQRP